jgi:23S rRNA (guanine745-N1)-methyltransferase
LTRPPLACTVRECGQPLERQQRTFACSRGHAFDIARSGYVNLLQPQDRRSPAAGDSKAAVQARARLTAAGVGRAWLSAMVERAASLALDEAAITVDLGSGTGEALAALGEARAIGGIGIDLSTAAAELAALCFPAFTWVVANADRRLPLLDRRVDLVLSLHGRRNPVECARVLKPGGFLLIAVPARDDLIELRALVHSEALDRERTTPLQAEHEGRFALVDRWSARERARLERPALLDLLRATYRGARARHADRVNALTSLEVTLASDFLLFAPRPGGG